MRTTKLGFSIVEVVIVVVIIILLAVIGIGANNSYQENTKNSQLTADVNTIKTTLSAYRQEIGFLPMPGGNVSYFDEESNYAHDETDAFGVHGFITEHTLPAKYINYLPLDPRTNQYYAYGKTIDGDNFEVSGVMKEGEEYVALVHGNYSGESGPYNLIREYNGPNFVYHNGTDNMPYNPDERLVVAKVDTFSGTVTINNSITSTDEILSYTLTHGDSIEVASGGFADIYFSDGAESTLGNETEDSELVLAKMEYTEDNNLVTQIALALNAGSLWTKAPNYDDESEFEVYTTDMVAAVRGTVFGVTKDSNKSNITVEQGKVEIAEITEDLGIENLVEKIESNTPLSTESIDVSGVTEVQNGVSYIEVGRNETSAGVDLEETTSTSHAEEQLERDENITNNDQTDVESIEISSDTPPRITLQFRIKDKLKRAQHIVVSNAEGRFRTPLAESLSGNIITLVENTQFEPIQVERSIVSEPTLTLGGVSNGTQSLGQIIQGNAAIGVQVCRIVNRKVQCTRTKFVNTGNAMQYQYDSRTDTPETTREIQPIVRQSCIAELQDGTTIDIPHAQNIALYTTASIAYDAANTCEDERQIFSCNDGQLLSATRDLQGDTEYRERVCAKGTPVNCNAQTVEEYDVPSMIHGGSEDISKVESITGGNGENDFQATAICNNGTIEIQSETSTIICNDATSNDGYHFDSVTNSCVLNKKESSLYEGEENIVGTKTEIWNNVLYSFYDISCIDDYIALDDHSACKKEFINTNILLAGTSTKIGTMKQRLDTTNGSYINDSIVSCEAGYHLELNNCKINTKTGAIDHGVGEFVWNGTWDSGSWSTTHSSVESCNSGYTPNGNACAPTCSTFWVYESDSNLKECVSNNMGAGWNVYAYAPYNIAGDLYLYNNLGKINSIGIATDYVANIDQDENKYSKDGGGDAHKNGDELSSIGLSNSDVTSFTKNNSFVDIDNTKGIFLTTVSSADYLKYNNLDLSGDYAIEMRVRGEDMNNKVENKYLWSISGIGASGVPNGLSFAYLGSNASGQKQTIIKLNGNVIGGGIQYDLFSNDKNYNIIFIYNSGTYNLIIQDGNTTTKSITGTQSITANNLYIGGDNTKQRQLNGIIDFLKIYKKTP